MTTQALRTEGIAVPPHLFGRRWYVDAQRGQDTNTGKNPSRASASVGKAVSMAAAGDSIFVAPGQYSEEVIIPRAKANLRIIGTGGRGAAFIVGGENEVAFTNEADDLTLVNIGLEADGVDGIALLNRGARMRAQGCKIEGGAAGAVLTLGTAAQIAAETHGTGADLWFVDCEFAWSTKGVEFRNSDHGALTQVRFRDCTFHDNADAAFEEANQTGGTISILWRDVDIGDCHFLRQEDGTEPAAYILLNDDNGNKGVVWGCDFPTAINGGKNLVSTGLIWVGNLHTGGISAAQPSAV